MREVATEAIERARRGDGPTLIEAQTYRFRGHSLADPDELREKKEKDHWQALSLHYPACLYAAVDAAECISEHAATCALYCLSLESASGGDKSS